MHTFPIPWREIKEYKSCPPVFCWWQVWNTTLRWSINIYHNIKNTRNWSDTRSLKIWKCSIQSVTCMRGCACVRVSRWPEAAAWPPHAAPSSQPRRSGSVVPRPKHHKNHHDGCSQMIFAIVILAIIIIIIIFATTIIVILIIILLRWCLRLWSLQSLSSS